MSENDNWELDHHFYNQDIVTWPVYKRFATYLGARGFLYIQETTKKENPSKDFNYTVSMGANSDRSYSGCFYNTLKIDTLEKAMIELNKIWKN